MFPITTSFNSYSQTGRFIKWIAKYIKTGWNDVLVSLDIVSFPTLQWAHLNASANTVIRMPLELAYFNLAYYLKLDTDRSVPAHSSYTILLLCDWKQRWLFEWCVYRPENSICCNSWGFLLLFLCWKPRSTYHACSYSRFLSCGRCAIHSLSQIFTTKCTSSVLHLEHGSCFLGIHILGGWLEFCSTQSQSLSGTEWGDSCQEQKQIGFFCLAFHFQYYFLHTGYRCRNNWRTS